MNKPHIFNEARFNQKANFNSMIMAGSDIDFFCEIKDKMYLFVEWKTFGTSLPRGQSVGYRRLTTDLGLSKPTFTVVANHDTTPSEYITGDNSYVTEVFYRLPNMQFQDRYFYEEGEYPTLNEWLADFSYEWRLQHILQAQKNKLILWEGVPQVDRDNWDGEQVRGPSAFFDYIRPVRQAFEFA